MAEKMVAAGSDSSDAFVMENGKNYRLTMKYKVAAGSWHKDNKVQLSLVIGSHLTNAGARKEIGVFEVYELNSNNGTLNADGYYVLNADTKWRTAVVSFTYDSAASFLSWHTPLLPAVPGRTSAIHRCEWMQAAPKSLR